MKQNKIIKKPFNLWEDDDDEQEGEEEEACNFIFFFCCLLVCCILFTISRDRDWYFNQTLYFPGIYPFLIKPARQSLK